MLGDHEAQDVLGSVNAIIPGAIIPDVIAPDVIAPDVIASFPSQSTEAKNAAVDRNDENRVGTILKPSPA
jgi:hypothetical protein